MTSTRYAAAAPLTLALLAVAHAVFPHDAVAQEQPPRIEIEARLMSWFVDTEQPVPDDPQQHTSDFFIRRARLSVKGRVTDAITVRFQVGQDNVGAKVSTADDSISIKDAYVNLRASDALQIAAGQFKVPFLRANLESGFNQMLVDRGTLRAMRPAVEGSRDLGVMGWGNLRGLQYRLALFDGSDQDAAGSSLRVSGRLAHNWFTRETDLGYSGTELGRTRVLQVAVQADAQNARLDPDDDSSFRLLPRDYRAYAVEAFYEQPVAGWALTADSAWLHRSDDYRDGLTARRRLRGYYAQGGVLLPALSGGDRLQFAVRREEWTAERGTVDAGTEHTTAGGTYYFDGHSRKLQADYTVKREEIEVDNDELRVSFVLIF